MPLEAPNLDDRRFTDLVAEARSRIPRYAPEWTDHNLSDPGITLIQLFAWLGEIILFRLNQVPERNYIRFLQLIGIDRKQAIPAKAELTFVLASPDTVSVVVPRGTQVQAEAKEPPSAVGVQAVAENEEPVGFETDEPMNAIGATLEKVQVFDGINFVDYTEANQPTGKAFPAFGSRVRENSSLMLGFASNHAFPTVEINLFVRIYADPSLLQPMSAAAVEGHARPPATILWEYFTGTEWRKVDVLKDETRALSQSGHVYFRGPKSIKKARLGAFSQPADPELYWLRARVIHFQYELPPELDAVLVNTVRATAVTTARDEVLGSSNGEPKQIFQLRSSPVFARAVRPVEDRLREQASANPSPTESEAEALDRILRERELAKGFWLEVDEGRGFKPWEEVEDLFNSGADDFHYMLNRASGEVRFGNGERGAIPGAGINNVVVRHYRYGGGARGNVGAETITGLQTSVVGIDKVTNNYPAEGGADEESIEDTKSRAPGEIKARDRAVTNEDFEFLARQTPGVRVRRAHALPLHHPEFPDVQVPGVVTVIVVPESKDPKPVPSEATLEAVCRYLNKRRLLTTEVLVAPPRYKHVKVEAVIIANPTADAAIIKTEIEKAITKFLHPLEGGTDGQGWKLGGDILYSEVFRVVLGVAGVQTIQDLRIVVDGERFTRCEDAPIPDAYLVFSDGHDITVLFTGTR